MKLFPLPEIESTGNAEVDEKINEIRQKGALKRALLNARFQGTVLGTLLGAGAGFLAFVLVMVVADLRPHTGRGVPATCTELRPHQTAKHRVEGDIAEDRVRDRQALIG